MKKTFYTEFAFIFGLIILSFSGALMEKANLGLSMVIAPAYLLHLKVSEFLPWFSFGMAGYVVEFLLLVLLVIITRKFKFTYVLSFVTALIYGVILDGSCALLSLVTLDGWAFRITCYVLGVLCCAFSVALLFKAYFPPEAYEVFVKEIAIKYDFKISRVKWVYDFISCLIAIIMSFSFFGFWHFEGVKIGTLICALINGVLIGWFTKFFDKVFDFKDGLKVAKYFKSDDVKANGEEVLELAEKED